VRTHDTPMLLEQVNPEVRQELVRQRASAMRGELDRADSALRDLLARQAGSGNDIDVVALAMSRAELLQLDERAAAAMEQFQVLIRPRLDRLDLPIRLAVEQNYVDLKTDPIGPDAAGGVSDFYHLYDRKQAAAVEWSDNLNLAVALEAIEKQNHRKALSALWYEAIRTYRLGCWGVHRVAMRRLGEEWLRIGEPADAAYCAILSLDDGLAGAVADDLLRRMDPALAGRVVARVLEIANLRKHFCTGCEFLSRVGDAIADEQLGAIAEWLLPRCSIQQDHRGTAGPVHRAWRALLPIAHRLPSELARRAIVAAVTSPAWTGAGGSWVAREQIVETVNHLVPALPEGDLEALAHQALPLATERMLETDFVDVINLLCHMAVRGGDGVRDLIGDRLFAPDRPRYHVLGQVAHVFGREFLPIDRLHQLPTQVTRNVRLQVQRRPRGQPFEQVPGAVFQITRESDAQTILTSGVSMMDWHATARHRQQLPQKAIREMALAALDMVVDPDNDLSNRASLINGLMELSDMLDGPTAARAFDVLERIARGEIEVSSDRRSGPLDVVRVQSTTREDLRAIALVGAAQVGSHHADLYRERLEDLLDEAFSAPEVEVRQGAFAAFRDFPVRSEGPLLAVLLGTRDPDPGGAITAFAALAEKRDLALNRNHWRLLLYSTRLAGRSTSRNLRRHAAATLAHLIDLAPGGAIRRQAEDILTNFGTDISASVREAAQRSKQ